MKAEIYIFGNFADGYSQYPDNYTRDLFADVSKSRRGATELVYHREGALTYYIYIREISRSANTFIGLCYVFNGILITDFSYLFDTFEDVITNIVVNGELLEFTNDGNLSTKVNQLYTHSEELQRVSDYLNNKLSSLGKYVQTLPPINFSISNTEKKILSYDELDSVHSLIKDYSNLSVVKGENFNSSSLTNYAHKLREQNSKILLLSNEVSKQKDEITKLQRQKKQFTVVLLLIAIIAIGAIVFVSRINLKNEMIQNRDITIESLEHNIKRLQRDSMFLDVSLSDTKETLRITKNSLESLRYDYNALKESDEIKIDSLKSRISSLEKTVANLRYYSNSGYSYTVGASTSNSISDYDSGYTLWLETKRNVRINSFYVRSNKSGYITFGVYNMYGGLVSSYRTYIYGGQWNKIEPNFNLTGGNKYYLAIKDSDGISLGYHRAYQGEYNEYKKGSLHVIGYSSKGNTNYETKYYQYFYNINYSVID